ncbi:hypothetical protein GCM10010446_67530 [Streptomyces enissocaesilis]|uniref:Uncharacterized protein n=1 Tax=Streptomyces enissocaesilis TaxID=332589 RepID=A0ABN3XQN0_9ACTN
MGLARQDMPVAAIAALALPPGTVPATDLELQQEITPTHFRVLNLRFPRCTGGADQLVRWGLRGFRFTRSAVAWSV